MSRRNPGSQEHALVFRLAWLTSIALAVLPLPALAQVPTAPVPTGRLPAAEKPVPEPTAPRDGSSLGGRWHAEPMTVRWVIGSWGDACGPRPSGGGDNGGEVSIEERGSELVIAGAVGAFSTEQCAQMHPGLSRQSHTANPGSWKSTCRTAQNDPRQEILQTTVSVANDVISLQESGQYQFVVQGQTCAASSGRWRTYRRLPAEPSTPVASEPVRAQNPCAQSGIPARIEVRPSRKLMRAGETFSFRASVFDGRGCSLGTPVQWSLSPEGAEASIDAGRLVVAAGAGDTVLRVTATAASQSVQATVDVVSSDRYAALLASGEFNADGASSEAATATITAGSLGARQAGEVPEKGDRKWTFVGLVSAIALVFALLGAWLLRRAQRAGKRPVPLRRPLPETGTVTFSDDDAVAEPRRALDRTRLEPLPVVPAAKPATVCPVCGTMYDTRAMRVCPKDGAQLLPINA